MTKIAARLGRRMAGPDGMIHKLPGGGAAWTEGRDMPAPAGRTFRELYAARRAGLSPSPVAGQSTGEA
jgi:hypothetical protein